MTEHATESVALPLAHDLARARKDADQLAQRCESLARVLKRATAYSHYYRQDVERDVSRIIALAHALERDVRGY